MAASPSRKRRSAAEEAPEDDYEGDDIPALGLPSECLDATIKLFVTHTEPNYSLPWQMRRQNSSTSTGFVISGRRILTNAHCVDNQSVVKVKKRDDSTKFIAEVLAIGRECDLALLTVSDEEFWRGISPIQLADGLPSLPKIPELPSLPKFKNPFN